VQAELREKPAANEGTCDSDEEVADDPEPGALHDLAASYPAMRPTTNTTRKLSPDICIFVFSRFFGRSDKNPAVFRERESHWLGWKRTLPVTRRGTTLLRHRGYHHTNRKTVQNCSTQEVCRFIHMSRASAKWDLVKVLILGWSCRPIFNNAMWRFIS
jgi:hypothetical protein